jgi:hypothetical protein
VAPARPSTDEMPPLGNYSRFGDMKSFYRINRIHEIDFKSCYILSIPSKLFLLHRPFNPPAAEDAGAGV